MKKFICKILNITTCPECNSINLSYGYYNRGWNNLCGQAIGDYGYYCNKCGKIHFEQNIEKYKSKLPDWCTAY